MWGGGARECTCTYMYIRIRLFVILIYFVCEESWTFCRPRRTLSIRLAIYVYIILCVCIIGPYIAHCSQNIILLKKVVAAVTRYIVRANI